jgi:hypothetical protein
MLDFTPLRDKELTMSQLTADLGADDLRRLTDEMADTVLGLISACVDADVTFVPEDPDAHDPFADDEADVALAWTLGHVIVHITASSEESAALAAELARGVEFHGRSRYETPWEIVRTIAQCRQRLEESRRLCLASLDMWPDRPHLDNVYEAFGQEINAVTRFVWGLKHADDHLGQIEEIARQASAARAEDG